MTRALAVLGTTVVVLLAAACAPQAPDHSSWTDQAHQALEDTASQVATVSLLLRLEQEDKVPGKYQQVVAQDSESAVGAVMSDIGGEQPVPRDDAEYRRVTGVISDASDLLSEVRIAVVRRNSSAYPKLLDELEDVENRLNDAAEDLR